MRGGQLLEVEELRNHQRLLVARDVPVSAFARNLGAIGEIVAGDPERQVFRIDARQRNVNAPAVVRRVHVERWRRTGSSAGRQIAPKLVEETIHLTLEVEDVIERIPTGETKHRETSLLKRTSKNLYTTCFFACQVSLALNTHITEGWVVCRINTY